MQHELKTVAALHAAHKELGKLVKNQEFPPGESVDVGGMEVLIRIPEGTTVHRPGGVDGTGIEYRTGTSKIYGYAVLFLFIERLRKFHQSNVLLAELLEAIKEAIQLGLPTKSAILKRNPEIAGALEKFEEQVRQILPNTEVKTPVRVQNPSKLPAAVEVAGLPES